MNNIKKLLIIAFATLLGTLLTSCGETTKINSLMSETSGVSESISTSAEPENGFNKAVSNIPNKNYDGYEFIILTRDKSTTPFWYTRDVYSDGIDSEPINDAVYERNRILEEKLNIKIKALPCPETPTEKAKSCILAGEDSFGALTDGLNQLAELALNGHLFDYNLIEEIKPENEWWDQLMNKGLSIKNRLYFMTGDISIMDNEGTWNVLFNKDYQKNLNLESPYDLVRNGDWTIDKMHTMATAAASDVDGDGVMKPCKDIFGLATEEFNTYALWVGCGMNITSKNKEDMPVLSMYSEQSVKAVEKALSIQNDSNIAFNHNNFLDIDVFAMGFVMFQIAGMRAIPTMRASDVDFGILPLPKYNEAQENYYTTYSHINLTAYSVPITSENPGRTGVILEAMASTSKYLLTPAYYEITLKGKSLRDDESSAMLDTILASRSYDLGQVFNFGGVFGLLNIINNEKFDFSSKYSSIEEKANSAITKFAESIK